MDWSAIWSFIVEYGGKFLTLLGGVAGLATLVIAIAQFMGKKWIEGWFEAKGKSYQHELDAKLKKYESELDANNRTAQSQLDTKLELLRIEYGTLYSKRLDVIEKLHQWLLYFKRTVDMLEYAMYVKFGNPNYKVHTYTPDDFVELGDIQVKIKEFETYFEQHKIFISKILADAIYAYYTIKLYASITKLPTEFIQEIQVQEGLTESERAAVDKGFEQINSLIQSANPEGQTIDDLLSMVQEEFRMLIGADIKR